MSNCACWLLLPNRQSSCVLTVLDGRGLSLAEDATDDRQADAAERGLQGLQIAGQPAGRGEARVELAEVLEVGQDREVDVAEVELRDAACNRVPSCSLRFAENGL